MIKQTVTRL